MLENLRRVIFFYYLCLSINCVRWSLVIFLFSQFHHVIIQISRGVKASQITTYIYFIYYYVVFHDVVLFTTNYNTMLLLHTRTNRGAITAIQDCQMGPES